MKKKVFATLLLAGMVLGTGQAAFAEKSPSPNTGYDIYDNGDGSLNEDLKKGIDIPVKGTLGPLDNTNPEENITEGDSKWIKVELPTEVLFHTVGDRNETIKSVDHRVTNLSGRPIKVSLGDFKAKVGNKEDVVKSLNLKGNNTSIDLLTLPEDKTLATLEIPGENENVFSFQFSGTTNTDNLDSKDRVTVGYTMNLKFEVLQKDGTPVTK